MIYLYVYVYVHDGGGGAARCTEIRGDIPFVCLFVCSLSTFFRPHQQPKEEDTRALQRREVCACGWVRTTCGCAGVRDSLYLRRWR